MLEIFLSPEILGPRNRGPQAEAFLA